MRSNRTLSEVKSPARSAQLVPPNFYPHASSSSMLGALRFVSGFSPANILLCRIRAPYFLRIQGQKQNNVAKDAKIEAATFDPKLTNIADANNGKAAEKPVRANAVDANADMCSSCVGCDSVAAGPVSGLYACLC